MLAPIRQSYAGGPGILNQDLLDGSPVADLTAEGPVALLDGSHKVAAAILDQAKLLVGNQGHDHKDKVQGDPRQKEIVDAGAQHRILNVLSIVGHTLAGFSDHELEQAAHGPQVLQLTQHAAEFWGPAQTERAHIDPLHRPSPGDDLVHDAGIGRGQEL